MLPHAVVGLRPLLSADVRTDVAERAWVDRIPALLKAFPTVTANVRRIR